ncbi:MAG: cache domain-containing protein [Ignavibacteria bacterium]|nr:cache domain-containing protein [Ignavibacteria bacterium]
MQMKVLVSLLVIFSFVSGAMLIQAQKGTPAEAESLVKKAVAYIKSNGREKAFSEFSNQKSRFVDRDLYIFVYDFNGKCLAHGGNPKLVGKSLIEMQDADGHFFIKDGIDIAKSKGKGWSSYKWTNNVSGKIEDKTAYLEKLENFVVGCGAYK